jgi:hypothetical protein
LASAPNTRPDPAFAQVLADEAVELCGLQELLKALGAALQKYRQSEYIAEFLMGQRTLRAPDRKRLSAVLRDWIAHTTSWLHGQADVRRQVQRVQDETLVGRSGNANNLVLLETYLGRIERTVARAKERLEQRLTPGSFFQNGGRYPTRRGAHYEELA